jgi:hypothetical protein
VSVNMSVSVAGIEPATLSSRTRCATRLRYTLKPDPPRLLSSGEYLGAGRWLLRVHGCRASRWRGCMLALPVDREAHDGTVPRPWTDASVFLEQTVGFEPTRGFRLPRLQRGAVDRLATSAQCRSLESNQGRATLQAAALPPELLRRGEISRR